MPVEHFEATVGRVPTSQEVRMSIPQQEARLASTVTWEVRDGEVEAAAGIIARFIPEARKEPGLELLMVNQCASNRGLFLFSEVFKDAAAFEAHQQTPHFKSLIREDALPRLSKRERVQYMPL
jgi:quinol monooxygenase YgiN